MPRPVTPLAPVTVLVTVLVTAMVTAVALLPALPASALQYDEPVEDYASYQPQKKCRTHPRPGTEELARWITRHTRGGRATASMRSCDSGGVSEHKDGRAIDWAMDASRRKHRRIVRRLLERLFATDADDQEHALARRMGVMYVIWNDHMYASYHRFDKKAYLNGACSSVKGCSKTLRHRDHVHLSLSRAGGRGDTSWYVAHGS